MKKKLLITLGLSALIALSVSIGAYAANPIKLFINGKAIATDIQIIKGSSYVPLKVVSESLGAEVAWDGTARTITITPQTPLPTPTATLEPTPNVTSSPTPTPAAIKSANSYDYTLEFPVDRYPETAAHIKNALASGETAICTIDREGADENRSESLKGIPTKDGYDRDEFPMAMCEEGGLGADVAYVELSDNRGSGSWVGNQLEDYPNGTRILFTFTFTSFTFTPTPAPTPSAGPTPSPTYEVYYANCTAVKAAGKAPLHKGDPGYSTRLDRDGDGVACES